MNAQVLGFRSLCTSKPFKASQHVQSEVHNQFSGSCSSVPFRSRSLLTRAADKDSSDVGRSTQQEDDLKRVTEKWGLETGLFKVFASKEDATGEGKGQQAKKLLAKYGSAYLITSISFAIVSFTLCYLLVSSGVDVASLLGKVGIEVSATSEKVGTFAIAYAAHKALSPVRFPPTVALTPVIAKALGKKADDAVDAPPK